jgi:glycosyltransferase involved in cell wall biosynthesis
MKIMHWMKKENSGLAFSTLELAEEEERQGHEVCIRQPGEDMPIHGTSRNYDVHSIHSQLNVKSYFDEKPKIMWMHGEPLSSVGNGISMKAIVDLAPLVDCFICMRKEEHVVWNSIKRTYVVPKGIDLNRYKPMEGITERLSGEPAVLYVENWRGQRNPLYACLAMKEVYKKFPNARLHLYNCGDQKMHETFKAMIDHCKWWPFIRTLSGPVDPQDINLLYNRADMVLSCLHPLYARGIEAFGAGKAFISAGYRDYPDYPYMCQFEPGSMARAIIKCWEDFGKVDFRKWAVEHHNIEDSVREAVEVYERFL